MYVPNFIEIGQTFCGRTDGRTYGWMDGRTYWRTDISPSNVIRSTRRSQPKNWTFLCILHRYKLKTEAHSQ